mgnify:CR=1 FL=1
MEIMPSEKTSKADRLSKKRKREIQEMVDELEIQAKIAREEGAEGLELHRMEWFRRGHLHGLSIKRKYRITGDDINTVYRQCHAIISDEKDRTRIPEILLEDNTLVLRSRAGTYCPSLEAVKWKAGSYVLRAGSPELCQYCKRAWFHGALQAAVRKKLTHKNVSSRIRGDSDCVETFYLEE